MHDMEMLIMIDKGSYVTKIIAAVDKAGGIKLNKFRDLNFKEKQLVSSSTWAFFFTIFYYFYHGMWKKGLIILSFSFFSIIIIESIYPAASMVTWIISPVLFATRAPVNLYSKYKLNDDSWNPMK
jgi:hypothetical protein